MKKIILTLPENMLEVIDSVAKDKMMSRVALIRNAISESIGIPNSEQEIGIKKYKNREYFNGILYHCVECKESIKSAIRERRKIDIPLALKENNKIRDKKEALLETIITFLHRDTPNNFDYPKRTRETVTRMLLEHGQFTKEEIDKIYKKYARETRSHTAEYFKLHPDASDYLFSLHSFKRKISSSFPVEINYILPSFGCDYLESIGVCKIKIEHFKCPDCDYDVTNTPENVTMGLEELVCPRCSINKNQGYPKGVIKKGKPTHHGHSHDSIVIQKSDTDYFFVYHKNCEKGKGKEKLSEMKVCGIWIDNGRTVLSCECPECGYQNAIKTLAILEKIPVLSSDGGVWVKLKKGGGVL